MSVRAPDCDLHAYFRDPDKARAILDACIADNRSHGKLLVRVVHGKGKGDFRQLVHGHLEKHPDVEGYTLCDPLHGGGGASWVHIREDPQHPAPKPEETGASSGFRPSWRWLIYVLALVCLLFLVNPFVAVMFTVGIIYIGETKFTPSDFKSD